MANLIENRKQEENIIKQRFVRKKLQETANEIRREQDKRMQGFKSEFWRERTFSVTDNEMDFEHLKVHRFVDMKTRTLKDGTRITKKRYNIHNRIIMRQYNQLTKELAYGFTEEVKNQLRNLQ